MESSAGSELFLCLLGAILSVFASKFHEHPPDLNRLE